MPRSVGLHLLETSACGLVYIAILLLCSFVLLLFCFFGTHTNTHKHTRLLPSKVRDTVDLFSLPNQRKVRCYTAAQRASLTLRHPPPSQVSLRFLAAFLLKRDIQSSNHDRRVRFFIPPIVRIQCVVEAQYSVASPHNATL